MTNFADRTIWTGDNLDILRGINSESVDLIYLDPPFNSNRNYAAPVGSAAAGAAFKDTWTLSDLDVAWMGLIADEQPAMYKVLEAAGLTHGKGMQSYLCMMAVRLLEMRRVLKDTGSIYLHCDPTASHYLKLLMDSIYANDNFRSEITWRRANAKGLAFKGYPNNADILLYYSLSDEFAWNRPFLPHDPEYVEKFYRHVDPDSGRRYRLGDLTNPNRDRPNLTYEWNGHTRVWRWTRERMQEADEKGLIHYSSTGLANQKRYLDEMSGVPVDTIWDDIPQVLGNERVGYPTQKPLALLDRIIKASSNKDDVVLDPFCGCATACVAAENLERRWIGIDISPKAVDWSTSGCSSPWAPCSTTGLLRLVPMSLGVPTSRRPSRIGRTSTSSLASRRAVAMAAGQPSSSATLRLTMSSHATLVARTTLRTCSSSAATATGSRATVRRST